MIMTTTTYKNVVLTLIGVLVIGLLVNNCANNSPDSAKFETVVNAQSRTQANAKESSTYEKETRIVKTDKFEGIICSNFSEWGFVNQSNSFWVPTKDQILEAEEAIEQYLKDKPPTKSPKLWQKLARYKRQYVGIVVDGHKRIYCNFYCGKESLSDKPISVEDGGDCFFQVEYDIKDRTIYNLMINGEA
jgi:hypothetical protein